MAADSIGCGCAHHTWTATRYVVVSGVVLCCIVCLSLHALMHLCSGFGDETDTGLRVGCVDLLRQIRTRVKPQYHVFGHIHESYGCYTDGQTRFINASTCTLDRLPINPPVVFDVAIPSAAQSTAGAGTIVSGSASASTEAKSASAATSSPPPSVASLTPALSPSTTATTASSCAQLTPQSAASSNGQNGAAPMEV